MQIEERLRSLDGFVTFLSRSFSKTDHHYQRDLYQEAMIAVWKELEKAQAQGREVNDSYLRYKAKWTMVDRVTTGKKVTPLEPGEDDWLLDKPVTDDTDLLFHKAEIHRAISELSPRQREYVYLRFWRGFQKPELREHGAVHSAWYGNGKSPGARAKLAAKLAHLADGF